MKLNSDTSLALARALYRAHGCDWDKVAQAGRVRDDGVIVVKRPASEAGTHAAEVPMARRANGRG